MVNLKQKILRTGAAIGIGLSSFFYGCESMTPQERQAVGILGGLATVSPDLKPGVRAGGALARDEATRIDQQETLLEAAKVGKTNVTINVGGGGSLPSDYMIATDLATGESKIIPGTHWWQYYKSNKVNYQEGCIIYIYHNYKHTSTFKSKEARERENPPIIDMRHR